MRTVAWLNKKYKTLHHANGVDTCDDVTELMPLCDQKAAEAVIYARGAAMKELLVALRELVELEDMRLRLRQLHEMGCGTDYDTYHKRLPLAWAAARAVLGPNDGNERRPLGRPLD